MAAERESAKRRRDLFEGRAIALKHLVGAKGRRIADGLAPDLAQAAVAEERIADEQEKCGLAPAAPASTRAQKSSTIAL